MTSPAFSITTVSPIRISLRSISSSLCKVARATRLPPTVTGSSAATGVNVPVRPTWIKNIQQARFDPFRFVFESDRPARRFRGESENLPLRKRIHFHHRAIRLVGEIVPDPIELVNRPQDFLDRIGQPPALAAGQPEFLEQREKLRMLVQRRAFDRARFRKKRRRVGVAPQSPDRAVSTNRPRHFADWRTPGRPASFRSAFNFAKPSLSRYASPRTSRTRGHRPSIASAPNGSSGCFG